MIEDGWGATPRFVVFVAEVTKSSHSSTSVVGFALCYHSYSTWKGLCLYMEDLYVQPMYRKYSIGKSLVLRCAYEAKQTNCARLVWNVLKWNEIALDFYKRMPIESLDEWLPMRLNKNGIQEFLDKSLASVQTKFQS